MIHNIGCNKDYMDGGSQESLDSKDSKTENLLFMSEIIIGISLEEKNFDKNLEPTFFS